MKPTPDDRRLVTLILPAKNEEAAIGKTLRALPLSTLRVLGFDTEVYVLDGHSEDATGRIAREWGATVVLDREPGKGAALRHAREHFRGEFAVMLDADGTYATDAIPRVLAPLVAGHADVVMANRLPQPGAMPPINRVGNTVFSLAARLLYGQSCRDLCTGMWGFRTSALRGMPLQSVGFGLEAELFALSARLGLRLLQVPVDYLPRHGAAKLHPGRDGLRIARRLMRSRFVAIPPSVATSMPAAPTPASPAVEEIGA